MANPEQLEILKQGVEAWNRWRSAQSSTHQQELGVQIDLRGANFAAANLRGADFAGANLRGIILEHADLARADFHEANLSEASLANSYFHGADLRRADLTRAVANNSVFKKADLIEANLTDASLEEADLSGANLMGAILTRADLTMTNVTNAEMGGTILGDVNMACMGDLNTVRHFGPSVVGIDTLCNSQGRIPDQFLRRAGVQDDVIQGLLPGIRAAGHVERTRGCSSTPRWLIRYSAEDQEFAGRLYWRVKDANMSVWREPGNQYYCTSFYTRLFMAAPPVDTVRSYPMDWQPIPTMPGDTVILILSQNSLRADWVARAVVGARVVGGHNLCAVRLVDAAALADWKCLNPLTGENLAAGIKECEIVDFREWRDSNAFEGIFNDFARQMSGLQGSASIPTET